MAKKSNTKGSPAPNVGALGALGVCPHAAYPLRHIRSKAQKAPRSPIRLMVAALLMIGASLGQDALCKLTHSQTITLGEAPLYQGAKHLPYADPNAKKGGTLSTSAQGTFNSLNPFINKGTPAAGVFNLYDTLMTGSLDEVSVMYPQLASGVTYDDSDGSWIIYHLDKRAKFWDGSPVTAADVKASFDAIMTQGLMSWRSYLADIDQVMVIDAHTVKFTFKQADNREIAMLVGQMPIFAKSSIDQGFDKVSLTPLMGSGAYQVGRIDAGRSITYKRDPKYWGQALMVNVGRFNFDEIKYVYYQSDEIASEGFKTGQFGFRVDNRARNWATGYTFDAARQGKIIKESIANHNPTPMQALVMNLRRPIFSDIRTRQALNLAFDFEWMKPVIFYGQYERLHSYFHGSELAATGKPSADELAILRHLPLNDFEKTAIDGVPTPSISGGDGFNRQNLLRARQLLLDAGFYYKQGKLYTPTHAPFEIEFLVNSDTLNRVLLSYARNLKRLGIDLHIRQVDGSQYLERTRNFDYDMILDIFAQSSSPGAEQAYLWGSAAADEAGNQNSIGIKSQAIDQLISELVKSKTRQELITHTKVLDRLLLAGHYVVPTYGSSTTNVAYWHQYHHPRYHPKYAIAIEYWWQE